MKKRIALIMLGLSLAMASAGCGTKPAETAAAETTAEETAAETEAEETEAAEETSAEETEAEETETAAEAAEAETPAAEEHEQMTDIEGCATFTDIVNKLEKGWGYANITLDGTDVFLVTNHTFDEGDGKPASTEAELFFYNADGAPEYLGYVASGGTANPLAVKDGKLYSGGHHWVIKNTVTDGKLVVMEIAWETFDKDGSVSYHYDSDDGGEYEDVEDASVLNEMFDEFMNAEIVEFSVVE